MDAAARVALVHLNSFRGRVSEVEFYEAAGRMAARLRGPSAPSPEAIAPKYMMELTEDGCRRDRWLRDAQDDLDRRWGREVAHLKPQQAGLGYARTYEAECDAERQRSRLEDLLPRRLASIRTAHSFFAVVDALVEDGLARHLATLQRLRREEDAERLERERREASR